jgi:ABC-type transport system involved in multi-copper enzyme maturation permease subunit
MATPAPPAVYTRGLTKRFGRLVAVKALDLVVEPGQVYGFLGLNGAGKTTTIRLSRSVSRAAVMTRSAVLLVVCPAFVIAAMALGTFMGLWLAVPVGSARPAASLVWSLAISLWSLLACWCGVSLAISSVARRRAVAGAIAGSAAAALILIDYLSHVWKPLRGIARLSPFHYYNPLNLVMGRPLPLGDIGVLLGTAAAAVATAYVLFNRRDV